MASFALSETAKLVVAQVASAGITGIFSINSDTKADQDICDKIDATKKQTAVVNGLIQTVTKASELSDDTRKMLQNLNTELSNERTRMLNESKKFTVKILVTIIVNIVIVTFVFLQLFS